MSIFTKKEEKLPIEITVQTKTTNHYLYDGLVYDSIREIHEYIFNRFIMSIIDDFEKKRWERYDRGANGRHPHSRMLIYGLQWLNDRGRLNELRDILDKYTNHVEKLKISTER